MCLAPQQLVGLLGEVNSCLGRVEPTRCGRVDFLRTVQRTKSRLYIVNTHYSPRRRQGAPVWAAVWKSTKIAIKEMTMWHDFRKGFSKYNPTQLGKNIAWREGGETQFVKEFGERGQAFLLTVHLTFLIVLVLQYFDCKRDVPAQLHKILEQPKQHCVLDAVSRLHLFFCHLKKYIPGSAAVSHLEWIVTVRLLTCDTCMLPLSLFVWIFHKRFTCAKQYHAGIRGRSHMFYCENQPDPLYIFYGDFLSVMMRVSDNETFMWLRQKKNKKQKKTHHIFSEFSFYILLISCYIWVLF